MERVCCAIENSGWFFQLYVLSLRISSNGLDFQLWPALGIPAPLLAAVIVVADVLAGRRVTRLVSQEEEEEPANT